MKIQSRVEMHRGRRQEGKRFNGRFSILINDPRNSSILINAHVVCYIFAQKKPSSSREPSHVHVVEAEGGEERGDDHLHMIRSIVDLILPLLSSYY